MKSKNFPYPISVKAYHTFIVRIRLVIKDTKMCETMEKALHYYLIGRDDVCFGMLNDECRMAFSFLRHDIDDAVCRSESARERALKRKAKKEKAMCSEAAAAEKHETEADRHFETTTLNKRENENPAESNEAEATGPEPIRLSRRQRRAEARALRPKRKWLPIGKSAAAMHMQ